MPLPRDRYISFLLGDALAAALATVLALWVWSLTAGFVATPAVMLHHWRWLLVVPLWVAMLSGSRHPRTAFDLWRTARAVVRAAALLLVAYLALYFLAGSERLPRLVVLYVVWGAAWWTLAFRLSALWLLTRDRFVRTVAVIGDDDDRHMVQALAHEPALADARMTDALDEATEIVVSTSVPLTPAQRDDLFRRQEEGVRIVTLADFYEDVRQRVPVSRLGHDWVVLHLLTGGEHRSTSPLLLRLMDVTGATVLLALGWLPMLVAAIAVVLESGAPAFYSQERVGQAGRRFRLTKLRTMRQDAEQDGPQWSAEADPRVTRVGRLLRRMHVDELPNVWAVLRGHMSLVGPRPERPHFVALLERELPLYRARLAVKPGLTGWAQVRCEYADSVADAATKLEYDLYYVRRQSLALNVNILWRTAGRMVGLRGR